MIRRFRATFSAFAALLTSPALADPSFTAGEWQHQTTLVKADVPGVPEWLIRLFAGRGSRTSCNTQADVTAHPETLLNGDDSAICKLRKLSMSKGRLVFDTFCTNSRFPDGLLVASQGSYTPTSYSISTISTGTKNGKPVRIETTGVGKRVAATCGKS